MYLEGLSISVRVLGVLLLVCCCCFSSHLTMNYESFKNNSSDDNEDCVFKK